MNISLLERYPSFDFDIDLLAYQQDDVYLPFHPGDLTAKDGAKASQKIIPRISLACIQCRSRHVKCNAGVPSCSRCQAASRSCSYAKSKRGARSAMPRRQNVPNSDWNPGLEMLDHPHYQAADNMAPVSFASSATPETPTTLGSYSSLHGSSIYSPPELLDLYYANFHDAHPIVLPRRRLLARLHSNPSSLQHLTPVMIFIGSLYIPDISSGTLREEASAALKINSLPMNGFSVQALMLCAVATHGCDDFEEGQSLLNRSITMALEIKMNSRSFALEHGDGDAVSEDSWRRTWWFLFVIDGTFAGIRHDKIFTLSTVHNDVDLPCEEQEYSEGIIPVPRSLKDYDIREFADEEIIFSSFAYLIDAARIIGAVILAIGDDNVPLDANIANTDARLVNWGVHLPVCKKDLINKNGEIDEILFQAHVLINIIKLSLHRPRSYLTYNCVEETSKCTLSPPAAQHMMRIGKSVQAFHTHKTLESLETMLVMMTLPVSILKHTPLIICGIAVAINGQIASCILVLENDQILAARERVRLGFGALKIFTEVWPLAKKTSSEMKVIARELLDVREGARDDGTRNTTIAMGMTLSCEKQ